MLHAAHVAEYYFHKAHLAEQHVMHGRLERFRHLYCKLEFMFVAMGRAELH